MINQKAKEKDIARTQYLNEAVVKMEPEQDGRHIGIRESSFPDNGTNNGLGIGACLVVETDCKPVKLALRQTNATNN